MNNSSWFLNLIECGIWLAVGVIVGMFLAAIKVYIFNKDDDDN